MQDRISIPYKTRQILRQYFGRDAGQRRAREYDVCCVVTGSDNAHLHHLNRNPRDNQVSNLVPLAPDLNVAIGGLNRELSGDQFIYKQAPLPAKLYPKNLLARARANFEDWRDTDAYGCAQLAYWNAHFLNMPGIRFTALIEVLRYARHAFHPDILQEVLHNQLLPVFEKEALGVEEITKVLMELTSLYAWIGCAEKSNRAAVALLNIIKRRPGEYDKRIRRSAYSIGVLYPEQKLARMLLAESAEAASDVDEFADLTATNAAIAIVNLQGREMEESFERLLARFSETEKLHIKGSPTGTTLNNAIGEAFYLLLLSLHLDRCANAKQAEDRLKSLIRPDHTAHRYVPPASWEGCWDQIVRGAPSSEIRDRTYKLIATATPSQSSYAALIVTLDEISSRV